jgi:hypothetical protein
LRERGANLNFYIAAFLKLINTPYFAIQNLEISFILPKTPPAAQLAAPLKAEMLPLVVAQKFPFAFS